MNSDSYKRVKCWVHWVHQEEDPDEDRLLMATDLDCFVKIAEAAFDSHTFGYISCEPDENCGSCRLTEVFRKMGEIP